ncbi:hypothetical protein BZG36_05488, partial [Bifiguratus adelaidae]
MVYSSLTLHVSDEAYLVVPDQLGGDKRIQALKVRRDSGQLELTAPVYPSLPQKEVFPVYGLFGLIQLQCGEYLVVITNRVRITELSGNIIYRPTSFRILPLPRNLHALSERQRNDEQTYVRLLEDHLRNNTFYVSYTYDLTHSLQRQLSFGPQRMKPMWERADERFFWNRFMCRKLIDGNNLIEGHDYSDFILPVVQGFMDSFHFRIHGQELQLTLMSRRSRHRAGTRYFSRGIDEDGHVSNYVETEQLISVNPQTPGLSSSNGTVPTFHASFVQTRGSTPIYWAQINNLRYTPMLYIMEEGGGQKSMQALRKHLDEQIDVYGNQVLVNLVNKRGYEHPMGIAYERTLLGLRDDRVQYTHFDFHHECKNLQWDRISLLLDQLDPSLKQHKYCLLDSSDANQQKLVQTQTGVIRTNCMDCLDRTNVVQTAFGLHTLNAQLRDMRVLQPMETLDGYPDFLHLFRKLWADNADALSIPYSGTGALKTDYTRTGARTRQGTLQDGVNSLVRYLKNNFTDGRRQDAIDLITGNYEIVPGTTTPYARDIPVDMRM